MGWLDWCYAKNYCYSSNDKLIAKEIAWGTANGVLAIWRKGKDGEDAAIIEYETYNDGHEHDGK